METAVNEIRDQAVDMEEIKEKFLVWIAVQRNGRKSNKLRSGNRTNIDHSRNAVA